jgi:hypothetical protein
MEQRRFELFQLSFGQDGSHKCSSIEAELRQLNAEKSNKVFVLVLNMLKAPVIALRRYRQWARSPRCRSHSPSLD